ncbi:MAG TPA: BTAD domain-containing putative transcriptional regulator, partial [Roseiflexaceae bacterium]|nr:BTAD domain-containing putative transcriptional regulator [Roseiflexaceae bacterium]
VALYRGELLHGLYLEHSVPFEEWLLAKREFLHIQVLEALHTLALHEEAGGRYEQMRQYAARQIALEPWREGAHRQLMRALALSGERAAALNAFETCRRVLEDELGISPSQETIALYQQIVAGGLQPVAPVPAARQAVLVPPEPPTPLLGREREVAAIAARLADPACRLVTLTGPGGVGKTHLSLAVAHECAALFEDGVAFVSLAAITDPELVYPTLASVLGIHQMRDQSPFASLVGALNDKRFLLLLDNFEQITAAGPHIGRLLAHTSRLKVLVTSRAALRLRAEFELGVEPLAVPAMAGTAAMAADYPAIELFVQRAQAIVPSVHLTDANAGLVVAICARVDGLPLAIELAAARIKVLSLPQLLQRLSRRLDLLSAGKQDLPRRHQALRNTIEWSYSLLAAEHQRLFARIAVFVGGCTLEAIEHVCASDDEPAGDVLDGLQVLVDNSLVRHSGDEGARRFSMLETIREYGLEQLGVGVENDVMR